MDKLQVKYILQTADNALIYGQRLSEWCGHGPILEDDIALTNIALDHLGLARLLFKYAAELKGEGTSEDDMAFGRDAWQYLNVQLAELKNGDFAFTILREFIFDAFHIHYFRELSKSKDSRLASIAQKTIKESRYHFRYSSVWVKRLGDGTDVSHRKMQKALDELWPYAKELVDESEADEWMWEQAMAPDLRKIEAAYFQSLEEVLKEAQLHIPEVQIHYSGGKRGVHTEDLGFLLADLQYLQRTYPQSNW